MRLLDLGDDILRLHLGEHLRQGLIATDGEVVFKAFRIDLSVEAENEAFLILVEWNVVLKGCFFACVRINIEQTIDNFLLFKGMRDDLADVFRLHLEVADPLWVDHDDWTLLAEPVASGSPEIYLGFEPVVFQFLYNSGCNFLTAGSMTGTTGAERNTGLLLVPFR